MAENELDAQLLAGVDETTDVAALDKQLLADDGELPIKSGPIDPWQRIIIQNIFDTQPKRRAAYLEKLGYEMSPKDDNLYRPMGAQHAYDMEIDPGGIGNGRQYMRKGGLKEAAQDMGDVVWDVLSGIPQEAAGVAGGVMGAPAGPVGAVAGRGIGRATMYQAFEGVKDQIGNQLLEKDMPPDMTLRYTQMALQAAAPEIIGKGLQGGVKVARGAVEAIGKGVRHMAGLGGGKISETIMTAIKKNPKLFSDKGALAAAGENVQGMIDNLMGSEATQTANPRKLPATSAFGQKLQELEVGKKAAISRLSSNRDAMPTVQQIIDPLEQQIDRLADTPGKSEEEMRALGYLKNKVAQIQKDLMPPQPKNVKPEIDLITGAVAPSKIGMKPDQVRVPFNVADDILTRIQDDVFDETVAAPKVLADAARNMRIATQAHAAKFEPEYAMLKEQQSKIFDAYAAAKPMITKAAAMRTIVGGETKGTSADVTQRGMTEALHQVDEALGTKFYDSLRTGQIQNQVYSAMEAAGRSRGSGGFLTAAAPAAAVAATPFLMAKKPGMAAVAGLAGGTAAGLASSPAVSIPLIAGTARASDALGRAAEAVAPEMAGTVQQQLQSFLSQQGSREVAPAISNAISPDDDLRSRLLEGVE